MTLPLHTEFDGIAGLRAALADQRVSARELAQSALDAIQAQSTLNAFLHVDADLTLAEADAAAAHTGSLAGVPIAHKDVFVTQGWRTTAGSKMLANYVSPFDATVVQHLRAAGAVSLGKLNCDEFAMGSTNENSAYGPVLNPWDHTAVAGGSSGGSAAAVAAGLVVGATGTDTGGSIRQPAALCGVSGIKPTYGTVSRYGMIAYGSSLDQGGAIARSALDLLELLDPITGFDERDSTSIQTCQGQPNAAGRVRNAFQSARAAQPASRPLTGLRIGVPKEYFGPGLAADVAAAIEAAIRQLESLGAERVDISLPRTELSIPAYYVIANAEASSNLSRFDGVRYGHRAAEYTDINSMIEKSRAEAFGPEVQRRVLTGTYVLSHGYYDAYYLQAQRIRRLVAQDFQNALNGVCDLIVGPVTPTTAWNLGEKAGDPVAMYLGDVYTLAVNLAGLPAMSVPCGFGGAQGRRPVGLQLIGNYFDEGRLLHVAHAFQLATDWHQRRPEQA